MRCLLEANELNEALKVLNSMDMEVFLQNTSNASYAAIVDAAMFDDTPKYVGNIHAFKTYKLKFTTYLF